MDLKGAVTLSAALICLLVGLTEGQQLGWGSSPIVGLFGGSVALFLLWGFIELRVTDPMVDMRMMARRVVLFTNLTAMLSGFALYMTWVILPTFYELPSGLPDPLASIADYGFGTSVTVAGPLDPPDVAVAPRSRGRWAGCWGAATASGCRW